MAVFYFDTSALLPVLIKEHELHEACVSVLRECLQAGSVATSATHAYVEMYCHLTRNIPPYNLLPEEAEPAITEHLGNLLNIIVLDKEDYHAAIHRCVTLSLTGAIIYDALHYQAALRAGAATIVTDNVKDFTRLVTEDEQMVIRGMRG